VRRFYGTGKLLAWSDTVDESEPTQTTPNPPTEWGEGTKGPITD